ncbi:MAG TPA: hypothetical protein VK464_00935 [Symbiobacteriaceae bacterium]|jgi:hypothetical protein|nr:hypothetical protein [Symbiobacteriaceae bacterium]
MKTGVSMRVIYRDADLLEVMVEASNGIFSARTEVWANADEPQALAARREAE